MAKRTQHNYFFPVGYHQFHKKQLFNFQLNRPYSWGYADFEDLVFVENRIHDSTEWKIEMTRLAEKALSKGKLLNSAFYYRAAEFYTFSDDPDKEVLYDKFSELFYQAIEGDSFERFKVPFLTGYLPSLRLTPVGSKRGTIIVHGGFDSFIETGFITNPNEEKFLNSKPGQDFLSSAIFRAVREYINEIESKSGLENIKKSN